MRAALAEVQKSQSLNKALLDNSPTDIYLKDTAGRFLLVNAHFATHLREKLRIEPEDLLGHTLSELAGEANRSGSAERSGLLKALGGLLGLLQTDPTLYLQAGAGLDEAAIQAQIQARADAKKAKNFAEADRIRNDLLAQGIVLKDSAAGTTWEAAP